MSLDLEAAAESVNSLVKVAAAFDRKNMPAGANANRVLAQQTQALVDEVRCLRAMTARVQEIADGTKIQPLADALNVALTDQCRHDDDDAECWHFGGREGRDG